MSLAVREYSVPGVDLEKLAAGIEGYFKDDDYTTQLTKTDAGYVVLATKEDAVRELLAADRAFTITVSGDETKVRVSIGVGKWEQNLAVEALEGIILSPLVFVLEVPVSLWSYQIEMELWEFVEASLKVGPAAPK